jgi:hypothetical protein
LLALLASAQTIKEYYIKSKLDPLLELQRANKGMAELSNYRYSLHSGFTIEDRKEVISEVRGEKSAGNTHIKGEMVNTAVDIYYIDRTIYNYDALSEKWLVIESDSSNSEDLLISELNPLSNFRFKELNAVEKIDFEKIDGAECLLVKCKPSVESQLLETMWKDFEYQFWIDYKKGLFRKAVLNASNKQTPANKLRLEVNFSDFNKDITIEPPDTSTKNNN